MTKCTEADKFEPAFRGDFLLKFYAAGHEPKLDEDGEPDWFGKSSYGHNGLACKQCDYGQCIHCWAGGINKNIPKCTKSFGKSVG